MQMETGFVGNPINGIEAILIEIVYIVLTGAIISIMDMFSDDDEKKNE